MQLRYANYSTLQLQLHYIHYTTATTALITPHPSYRFPIFETSATALRGTTGINGVSGDLVLITGKVP